MIASILTDQIDIFKGRNDQLAVTKKNQRKNRDVTMALGLGRSRLLRLVCVAGVAAIWTQTMLASLTISKDDNDRKEEMLQSHVSWSTLTAARSAPRSQELVPKSPSSQAPSKREDKGSVKITNKTLVVLIGNLRGGETAWHTLYENVLDVNSADLALFIGYNSTRAAYHNATLFERAVHYWTFPEFDDWADALDLIPGVEEGWRDRILPLLHNRSTILGGVRHGGFRGSGAIIFMIRWFLAEKIQQLKLTSRYDQFVITRSDHYYLCRHDLGTLDPNKLWVPSGSDWHGITDRHLVVNSKDVLKALNILPPLLQHPENYQWFLEHKKGNPEMILLQRWIEQGLDQRISRFDRVMFTCGETGDRTRWQALGKTVPEGVRLKYAKEYRISKQMCRTDI